MMHMHTHNTLARCRFVLGRPKMFRFPTVNRLTDKQAIALAHLTEGSDLGQVTSKVEDQTIHTLTFCSPDRAVFP